MKTKIIIKKNIYHESIYQSIKTLGAMKYEYKTYFLLLIFLIQNKYWIDLKKKIGISMMGYGD